MKTGILAVLCVVGMILVLSSQVRDQNPSARHCFARMVEVRENSPSALLPQIEKLLLGEMGNRSENARSVVVVLTREGAHRYISMPSGRAYDQLATGCYVPGPDDVPVSEIVSGVNLFPSLPTAFDTGIQLPAKK
jgi:hypothetical protein